MHVIDKEERDLIGHGRNQWTSVTACDREECGRQEGGGVYATLMESDAVYSSGRTEGDTRPGRTHKKPKDLSAVIVRRVYGSSDDFMTVE